MGKIHTRIHMAATACVAFDRHEGPQWVGGGHYLGSQTRGRFHLLDFDHYQRRRQHPVLPALSLAELKRR
jgi:hypothetical protein